MRFTIHSMAALAALVATLTGASPVRASGVMVDVLVTTMGVLPADSTAVRPYLPPGFDPVALGDSSPMGDDGMDCAPSGADCATLQVFVTTFTWADNPEGAAPVSLAMVWLYADPPDKYESPDRGPTPPSPYPYIVVPKVVVTSNALAMELGSMGLPTQVGEISQTLQTSPPGSEIWQVDVEDSDGTWRMITTVEDAPEPPVGPENMRFFGVAAGQLLGVVDFSEDEHAHSPFPSAAVSSLPDGLPGFPFVPPGTSGIGIKTEPGYTIAMTPSPTCCVDGQCGVLPAAECAAAGGQSLADGVPCDPNPCEVIAVEQTTWGRLKATYR